MSKVLLDARTRNLIEKLGKVELPRQNIHDCFFQNTVTTMDSCAVYSEERRGIDHFVL